MWAPILLASLGCYAEKALGFLLPQKVLGQRVVHHVAALMPVALLAGVVAVQSVTAGQRVVLDARVPGMAVAVALMARRTNFLVMVVSASATTALVRALGLMV